MTEILRNWIINIVFTLFLIILIEIMIPGEKFQKYLKFATGLLLIIVIINPITQILDKTKQLDNISVSAYSNVQNIEDSDYENIQNEQILNVYKEKLRNQIKEEVLNFENVKDASVDIAVNEYKDESDFGQIRNMNIVVYTPDVQNEELSNIIKNKLSNTYKVPIEKISVKTQKVG